VSRRSGLRAQGEWGGPRAGALPIVELVGLVEGMRLLEERVWDCVAACREEGCGVKEIARILGVHRATVYRLSPWGTAVRARVVSPPGRTPDVYDADGGQHDAD
jgi:hypothetical protein